MARLKPERADLKENLNRLTQHWWEQEGAQLFAVVTRSALVLGYS